MQALVVNDIIVVVAIVIAGTALMMVELCEGSWLPPLSEDLYSLQVQYSRS